MKNPLINALFIDSLTEEAQEIFKFLYFKNSPPDADEVNQLLEKYRVDSGKRDVFVTRYFIDQMKQVLINAAPESDRALVEAHLHIDRNITHINPQTYGYSIYFFNKYVENPKAEDLDLLYKLIVNFNFNKLLQGKFTTSIINLFLSDNVIRQVRRITESHCGVFEPTEPSNWNSISSFIIEIGVFKRLVSLSEESSQTRLDYQELQEILAEDYPNISELLDEDPQYLVIYEG